MENLNIGGYSKVTIEWNVLPIDYSRENEKNLIQKFSDKYKIPKENIKIHPNFISLKNKKGEDINIVNDLINNIKDPKFQHKLFKSYIKENNIDDYDFNKILEIDASVNNLIDFNSYDKYCKYELKWIKWDNFLSYGKDNYFDFTQLEGLVLLNGEPSNQSGKSTFAYDLLHFLFFGKTSSGKADVLSKMFNLYLPEETTLQVSGGIMIDGDEYVIKRTLTRPTLKKRTIKSKITQKVEYFKIVNGSEQELYDIENEEGSTNTITSQIIKESIGNEKDFDLVICANSDNLKSLISLKDSDRGRLLSKWIGLIVLEEKDIIARDIFNKQINPTLLSNRFNRETLKTEIKELKDTNNSYTNEISYKDKQITNISNNIVKIKNSIELLISSKREIDNDLINVDVETLTKKRDDVIEKGKKKKNEKNNNLNSLKEIENIEFNEDNYKKIIYEEKELSIKLSNLNRDIKEKFNEIDNLKKQEICPTCKRKLENIDFTETIDENNEKINELKKEVKIITNQINDKNTQIQNLEIDRKNFIYKNQLLILIEKNDVDIDNITKDYKECIRLLKELEKNKSAIINNNKLDIEIRNTRVTLQTEENNNQRLIKEVENLKQEIKYNEKLINEKNEIINLINDEEVLIKNWKLYLTLIGKNGISKVVLRNTLPLINAELKRLLSDVTDFDVEVVINEKNDVNFNLIRGGVVNNLSSGSGYEQTAASLALRVVLGNISTMPRPNFIVFDEVLGGVAKDNYDKIKLLYDRVVKNYSFIFQITHIYDIIDWHQQIVTVSKNDMISSINSKKIK